MALRMQLAFARFQSGTMPFAIALILLLAAPPGTEAQPVARRQLIGHVVSTSGEPMRGAFVTVRPSAPSRSGGLPELEAIADHTGRFHFDGVPPGGYRVAGHRAGFQLAQSSVDIAADRDTEVSLVMVMVMGAVVDCDAPARSSVRIQTRSGEPLPTAFVTVTGPGHRPLSQAVLPAGLLHHCAPPATEDLVTLDVLGYGALVLKPAGVPPETMAGAVVIDPSAASSRGRAHRPAATGQIRGRVFDQYGASIPDAFVSFEPLNPDAGQTPFEANTDARGRFDFAGVRPGTYRVTGKALGFETTVSIHEVSSGVDTEVTVVVRRRF